MTITPGVANAEELTLHVMSTEVFLIVTKMVDRDRPAPPKFMRSIENCLFYLDENINDVLTALPQARTASFIEIALFCLVTHPSFREMLDVTRWSRLSEFCRRFGERKSAKETDYAYDTP